jgi:hypothetical protein
MILENLRSESASVRRAVAIFLLVISLPISPSAAGFGDFVGKIVAEWLDNGREMRLLEDFAYIDPAGRRWEAPKGSVIDGASIPRFAWSLIGGPFEGAYRNASVIHDVACVERKLAWQDVHLAFYTAMRAANVSQAKAKVMYAAVYHFGPRWPTVRLETRTVGGITSRVPTTVLPPPSALREQDFQRLAELIEAREAAAQPVSLVEIRDFQ